jgi:hypothetical protein
MTNVQVVGCNQFMFTPMISAIPSIWNLTFRPIIVHYFSSGAHVWVCGAKTTGQIVKKFGSSLKI